LLPELPRLVHQALLRHQAPEGVPVQALLELQRANGRLRAVLVGLAGFLLGIAAAGTAVFVALR
jgi:hypothetical protein